MAISLLNITHKKLQQMSTRNMNSNACYSFAYDTNNMKQSKHRAGSEWISKTVISMQMQSAVQEVATVQ